MDFKSNSLFLYISKQLGFANAPWFFTGIPANIFLTATSTYQKYCRFVTKSGYFDTTYKSILRRKYVKPKRQYLFPIYSIWYFLYWQYEGGYVPCTQSLSNSCFQFCNNFRTKSLIDVHLQIRNYHFEIWKRMIKSNNIGVRTSKFESNSIV